MTIRICKCGLKAETSGRDAFCSTCGEKYVIREERVNRVCVKNELGTEGTISIKEFKRILEEE